VDPLLVSRAMSGRDLLDPEGGREPDRGRGAALERGEAPGVRPGLALERTAEPDGERARALERVADRLRVDLGAIVRGPLAVGPHRVGRRHDASDAQGGDDAERRSDTGPASPSGRSALRRLHATDYRPPRDRPGKG
jgi:hypothetical protein